MKRLLNLFNKRKIKMSIINKFGDSMVNKLGSFFSFLNGKEFSLPNDEEIFEILKTACNLQEFGDITKNMLMRIEVVLKLIKEIKTIPLENIFLEDYIIIEINPKFNNSFKFDFNLIDLKFKIITGKPLDEQILDYSNLINNLNNFINNLYSICIIYETISQHYKKEYNKVKIKFDINKEETLKISLGVDSDEILIQLKEKSFSNLSNLFKIAKENFEKNTNLLLMEI